MSLLREIQTDLATATGDVTAVLRKCKILAARLGSAEFAKWVECELNGYLQVDRIPEYRRLGIRYYGSFVNAAWHLPRQPVPLQLVPEEHRKAFETVDFRDGIAKAASFASSKHGGTYQRPELIFHFQGKMYPEMACHGIWGEVSKTEFEQLISVVKNRILDFSLKIEAENPNAGEAQPDTRPVSMDRLRPIVKNVFYGPVGNVAQNNDSVSQSSNIGLPHQDLCRLVSDLARHLDELLLNEEQKRRAGAQIAVLDAELAGNPEGSIVQQACRALLNIVEGAIGSLLASAAQPGVWDWISQTLTALSRNHVGNH